MSPSQTESPLIFTVKCYMRDFFLDWRAQHGVETPHFSGNIFQLRYPSRISAACGSGASLFQISTFPTNLHVSSINPVQLVFSRLFRLIFLFFSCNFSLVLGPGDCPFHLLGHHVGSSSNMLLLIQTEFGTFYFYYHFAFKVIIVMFNYTEPPHDV